MKKLIICFAAALMTLGAAQSVKAQKVSFGLKGGLNLSTWTQDDSKFRPGFHVGGFANIRFSSLLALQPEVMYSMEGSNWSFEESITVLGKEYYAKTSTNTTTHRLAVPVMLQITPIKPLTLELGPVFGFNLGMKSHTEFETNVAGEQNYETDRTHDSDYYNTFELGLGVGARYNIDRHMSIGARYVYGATPLIDAVKVNDRTVTDAIHTHNIMISFSYGF